MIHLIGFYTQGRPFDEAKDLHESKERFKSYYEDKVDVFKLYNTTHMMVKNTKFKKSIDPVRDYKFLDGWDHHFWKWKPFVIYEHLKDMTDGDVLVYHDCDIIKYNKYEKGTDQFRETVNTLMANAEIVSSIDTLQSKNKYCIKESAFLQFGDYRHTKPLKTNRIFIKKSPKTLQFIYNWMELSNTSMFNPNFSEKHSYSEGVFNLLYYKYVEVGEFKQPTVYFKEDVFSSDTLVYLDNTEPPQKVDDSFVITPKKIDTHYTQPILEVPSPARRMLPPHQSTRSHAMSMVPIAKPHTKVKKIRPPIFTLNKFSR